MSDGIKPKAEPVAAITPESGGGLLTCTHGPIGYRFKGKPVALLWLSIEDAKKAIKNLQVWVNKQSTEDMSTPPVAGPV